ncbi:MAG: hypothetical protein EA417_13775 [Gammaproteobacteria bacterium]|nr:MAG: hypothetical protein EA417_13775 [Gammaproteobacteria bacterium]
MGAALHRLSIRAVDTLFFREARQHASLGASELASLFPPPTRTILGAIRTWLGDALGVDWKAFARGDDAHRQLLGDSDAPGSVTIAALLIHHNRTRLWPCPADLLLGGTPGTRTVARLAPGPVVECDLGRIALPAAPPGTAPGSYVPADAWLTEEGARRWLAGECPQPDQVLRTEDLLAGESRLGIARDNARATVKRGLLYQVRHLRFRESATCIEAYVAGLPEGLVPKTGRFTLRLGGEGRMADVAIEPAQRVPLPSPIVRRQDGQLALWLVSPADTEHGDPASGLAGFTRERGPGSADSWRGALCGIELRLVSSCRPRAQREGGWDQKAHRPRAVRSLVPPGTVYFCEVLGDMGVAEAASILHGATTGPSGGLGRGRLLAGVVALAPADQQKASFAG